MEPLVEVFGRVLAVLLYGRSITGYWSPDGIPDDKIDEAYVIHTEVQKRRHKYGLEPSQLRGSNLACWCGLDQPCHVDVLLYLANR